MYMLMQQLLLKLNNKQWHKKKGISDNLRKCLNLRWWAMTGSNRRHLACKASALPAELIARDW